MKMRKKREGKRFMIALNTIRITGKLDCHIIRERKKVFSNTELLIPRETAFQQPL